MMTKRITIFTILFLTLNCNAQISIDSLLSSLNSNYSRTGSKEYLLETFTKFESDNKKDRYDVFLDSTDKLQEYIGLSIVHYSYDKLNRIILIEGFNRLGFRSYWDFPVITKFTYVSDTIVSELNKIRNEICNCKSLDSLSNVVVEKEISFREDSIYNKTRYKIFSQDSTIKLTYSICSNGKICKRGNNVFYIYREFDKKNKTIIIHERYYDDKLKLINGKHDVYKSENVSFSPPTKTYAYSIRQMEEGEIKVIRFYNKKGKLLEIKYFGGFEGPINVPN